MGLGGWAQYIDFMMITSVFAVLGRYSSEQLFGSLGDAHQASALDSSTGLLNRRAFVTSSASHLRTLHAQAGYAVLVMIDIDAFRRINLVIGHEAADHLLGEAARRLLLATGDAGHVLGRTGDNEFAVLGVGVSEERAEAFARQLHASLNFDYQGVSVRSAAGFSRFPRDAHGIESLMLGAESGVVGAKAREDDRFAGPADRI
jgi:diguanylate cyclase (GGDEF)-like protein